MTAAEILDEIRRLPPDEQTRLKQELLADVDSTNESAKPVTPAEFDQLLLDAGLLTHPPSESWDDDDYEPVTFTGEPISQTIIDERR